MTALPDWDLASDAELVSAAAAGDRRAFAGIYDRYADRLHDFCVGMVRDRDTAADCVQDVFCTAAGQLPKLRDPDKLRAWLYAIARNEALRHIRDRRREHVSDQLPDAPSPEADPDTVAARSELADLIAQAAGGLGDHDRTVLELAYRHGLDGPELAHGVPVPPPPAAPTVPVWVLPPIHVPPLQMPSGPKTGSPTTPTAHPRPPTPPVSTSSTPTPSSQRQFTQ